MILNRVVHQFLAAIAKRGPRARPCIVAARSMRIGTLSVGHAEVESAGTGGGVAYAHRGLQPLEGVAKIQFARESLRIWRSGVGPGVSKDSEI